MFYDQEPFRFGPFFNTERGEHTLISLRGKRSSFFIWIISFPNNGLFKYPVRDL